MFQLYLFVLVCSNGDKLSFFKGNVGNQTMTRADADDVQLRLIFMERVQHNLEQTQNNSSDNPGPKPVSLAPYSDVIESVCATMMVY